MTHPHQRAQPPELQPLPCRRPGIVHEHAAPARAQDTGDLGEKSLAIGQVVGERESVDEVDGPVTQRKIECIHRREYHPVVKTEIEAPSQRTQADRGEI
jgi:hypothetical protein